jgi:outer membrane protein insertion porin family
MGMGYFEEVKAVTVNADEPAQKNVNFEVKEKNTAHFKIGGGFSDTESLVGMVELTQTNFDLFSPENYFQGGGQRLRLQGFFGLERMDFNANFTEPWLFDMPLKLDVSGYGNQVKYEHWSERRIGVRLSLAKRVFDDFTTVTGAYRFEVVKVLKMDDWLTPEFTDQEGTERVGAISLAINRDTRNSLTDPTSGYQLNFLSECTTQGLGASGNYVRLEAKASHYFNWKFWEERMLVFHIGGKIGTVGEFNRNKEVPIFERYFLGGGDSLRGFPYRNVSPTATVAGDEIAIGGQSMLLLTAEVTHPIWDFIRGAVFCDVGGVNRSSFSFAADQLNMGVGYGLRVKVPYLNAPVKVDLAYPVINNVDGLDKKFRVHFNMGFTW